MDRIEHKLIDALVSYHTGDLEATLKNIEAARTDIKDVLDHQNEKD